MRHLVRKISFFVLSGLTASYCQSWGASSKVCSDVHSGRKLLMAFYGAIDKPDERLTEGSQEHLGFEDEFILKDGIRNGAPVVVFKKAVYAVDHSTKPQHEFGSLNRSGEVFQETIRILESLYRIYQSRGTVPDSSIAEMRRLDGQLKPRNLGYISFFDPITNEPKVMIRIFDGSPSSRMMVRSIKPEKLPIEREYPHLKLPDRAAGNDYLIELGRLGKEESVEGDLETLLSSAARYLYGRHRQVIFPNSNISPMIYVEALGPAARLYKNKYKFEVVYGPKELGIPSDQPARYILRIPLFQFLKQHLDSIREGYSTRP